MDRRSFMRGAAVFIAAPAVIRVADLMAVKAYADVEGEAIDYVLADDEFAPFINVGGFRARFDPVQGRWNYQEFDKRGLPYQPKVKPAHYDPDVVAQMRGWNRQIFHRPNGKDGPLEYVAKAPDALY